MIDIAKLRGLLAAATPGPWLHHEDEPRVFVAEHRPRLSLLGLTEDDTAIVFFEKDAALIVAAVNALPWLLDELEALRAEIRGLTDQRVLDAEADVARLHREKMEEWNAAVRQLDDAQAQLTAWRTATGCDGPEQAAQLARDAVVVREGHWDALLAERERWKAATDCDTPEEAGELLERLRTEETRYNRLLYTVLDPGMRDKRTPEEAHAQTMAKVAWMGRTLDEQHIELARLRELERTTLAWAYAEDPIPLAVGAALEVSIAACRAARKPPEEGGT